MAKLTPAVAVKHLRYIAMEEEKGRLTPRLQEIREHRLALLARKRACRMCGTVQTAKESIRLWREDGLGSECRRRLADPRDDLSPVEQADELADLGNVVDVA
jgi:hypothetical protein